MKNRMEILLVTNLLLLSAMAGAADIKGSVIAKKGDVVTIEFRQHNTALPKTGDPVRFSKEMFGTEISAGAGEITSVDGTRAEARITQGKPQLSVDALIEASGRVVKVKPRPATRPVANAPPTATPAAPPPADHGWGNTPAQSPEQLQIEEIIAAKEVCDYQTAEQLGTDALQQYPTNAWLKQNYPTLRTLAQRDRNYRQAMRAARAALDDNRGSDSITPLQTAMKNASRQCGQDQEVRGLHAEAEQILAGERAQAKQDARQRALEQARHEQARHAADERARAQREADAREVQQGLLETMRILQGEGSNASQRNTNTYQGDDWLEKARPKVEDNETWKKWRDTQQGW